jgi:preprotein translocase subunit SecA
MAVLEKIWEILSTIFGGMLGAFERGITSVFGSSNARYVKRLQTKVDAINALESKYEAFSDTELKDQTELFRQRLTAGESLDDILIEAFAVCREAGKRFLGMRHYDVQMIGGMVLHSGSVAEMVTGEGKTLVATLPAYLNALSEGSVHVVTVNDYLARRDMEWMGPLYMGLGLTVGAIQSDMSSGERQKAYACNITYGTNNEFGFDYLRDNMRVASRGDSRYPKHLQQSQGKLNYAIIDEVDNILIDEARTPLIISGPAHQDISRYAEANKIALKLEKEKHYTVNEKDHSATLTDDGVRVAEKLAGVESFYTAGNMDWPHLIDNSLKAHHLYKRDVDYVVKDNAIIIVDPFTGRLMDGRQWSDGLHQAVEAKEGVKIKEETQTLATITLQNYFKLYEKICGMTGTAMTEATEFWKIYKLDVIAIPTNREMRRIEHPDVIFNSEDAKWRAVITEIEQYHKYDVVDLKGYEKVAGKIVSENDSKVEIQPKGVNESEVISRNKISAVSYKGRPILVGTVSIEKSERLAKLLENRGIKYEVLNAKNHKREAEIVAQAGRKGAVTISTNMAGRGTDIVLGGNPETLAWARLQDKYQTRLDVPREEWDEIVDKIDREENMAVEGEEVKKLGGLHVIGTERHEARRIDLQLRGRCGRQGDNGSSRFFLSLDDDLMRIFAGPFVKRILEMGGFKDEVPIESGMVSRRIDSAQKKREEYNFEIRKNLLEYDEVMDEQRKRVYSFRQRILDGYSCREIVVDSVGSVVDRSLETLLAPNFGRESFAAFAGKRLGVHLESRLFKKMDFDTASEVAKDEAERIAETEIMSSIDENLPAGGEEDLTADWNWEALARFVNSKWDLNVRDRDLKKVGRDSVDELLVNTTREAIQKVDLSEGAPMLDELYPIRTTLRWVKDKFGVEIGLDEVENLEQDAIREYLRERAIEKYTQREADYPVMAGMMKFVEGSGAQSHVDREGLVVWARDRFNSDISLDDFKSKDREQIKEILTEQSVAHQKQGSEALRKVDQKVHDLSDQGIIPFANSNGTSTSFASWFKETTNVELDIEKLTELEHEELEKELTSIVADHYHPEMRRMERMVLLEIIDNAWKDHLLAMDYLRSAVRQRGMAQLDPKVEYKREGMRLFEGLWHSVNERVTDVIFRMEQLDEEFVSTTWVETAAVHEQLAPSSDIAREQQQAIEGSQKQSEAKINTIRNRKPKVGRNDPCHCGSGKKYKHCCMRKSQEV